MLYLFCVFACLGMTTEIFFTAFSNVIKNWRNGEAIDYSLAGKSYVWMFFIYGLAGIFFPPGYGLLKGLPFLLRLLIYAVAILGVEYIAGWFLDKLTGKCPWEYDSKWAIHGYIRLDYLPFWMIFGGIIEVVYLALIG